MHRTDSWKQIPKQANYLQFIYTQHYIKAHWESKMSRQLQKRVTCQFANYKENNTTIKTCKQITTGRISPQLELSDEDYYVCCLVML